MLGKGVDKRVWTAIAQIQQAHVEIAGCILELVYLLCDMPHFLQILYGL